MQKLQCELCGSVDIVRTNDGCFQCQHCGCKYTLEQAKAMLGTVETTIGTAELERLLKNAKTQYDLREDSEAEKTYTQITKQFPDDYRGWVGLQRISYRYYLSGSGISDIRFSPSADGAKQLEKRYRICQKLCGDKEALAEINAEWERFWECAASQCRSGKMTYNGGCDPEAFKEISAAMYELAKCGFSNAKILNSLNIWRQPDVGWIPKKPHYYSSYYFWLGNCVQFDSKDGFTPVHSEEDMPVLTQQAVDQIMAKVQKYINECVARAECPYCGGYIKSSLLGKKCHGCGRKF